MMAKFQKEKCSNCGKTTRAGGKRGWIWISAMALVKSVNIKDRNFCVLIENSWFCDTNCLEEYSEERLQKSVEEDMMKLKTSKDSIRKSHKS